MPAATFVGVGVSATDVSIGASADETGILLGDIDYSHDNPRVDFVDRFGGVIGFARNHNSQLNLTVNGEVDDIDAGVNVASFTAAATVANENFFASATETYNTINYAAADTILDSVSGSQPRGGARTITLNYIRPIGFAVSA